MKPIIMALFAIAASPAHAEEMITCHFTEPFITTKIESDMVREESPEGGKLFLVAVKTQNRDGSITVEYKGLRSESHTIKLRRDWQGSDGMSDRVFPYSAVRDENLSGGCESESEKHLVVDFDTGEQP